MQHSFHLMGLRSKRVIVVHLSQAWTAWWLPSETSPCDSAQILQLARSALPSAWSESSLLPTTEVGGYFVKISLISIENLVHMCLFSQSTSWCDSRLPPLRKAGSHLNPTFSIVSALWCEERIRMSRKWRVASKGFRGACRCSPILEWSIDSSLAILCRRRRWTCMCIRMSSKQLWANQKQGTPRSPKRRCML